MTTLLQQLGGRDAMEIVVAGFHERIRGDVTLRRFFRGASIERLQSVFVDFFCAALGEAPDVYRGRGLRAVHAGLAVSPADFDAVAGHLEETLRSAGVIARLIEEVHGAISALRDDIITREG